MNEILLKKLTLEYAVDIQLFRQEILDSNDSDSCAGCYNLRDCLSAKEWIRR